MTAEPKNLKDAYKRPNESLQLLLEYVLDNVNTWVVVDEININDLLKIVKMDNFHIKMFGDGSGSIVYEAPPEFKEKQILEFGKATGMIFNKGFEDNLVETVKKDVSESLKDNEPENKEWHDLLNKPVPLGIKPTYTENYHIYEDNGYFPEDWTEEQIDAWHKVFEKPSKQKNTTLNKPKDELPPEVDFPTEEEVDNIIQDFGINSSEFHDWFYTNYHRFGKHFLDEYGDKIMDVYAEYFRNINI